MKPDFESVYFFGEGAPAAVRQPAVEIGNKAAKLLELTRLGLPVPPGFVLSTRHWRDFQKCGECLPDDFEGRLGGELRRLEALTGRFFGGVRRPLLLAVRSGAPVSMPGMMETVLDVGVNETTVEALIRRTGNPRLAWDCYRRLVQSYSEVVLGCSPRPFQELVERAVGRDGLVGASDLDAATLETITRDSLELVRSLSGGFFPQDPMKQLIGAILAVLRSWRGERACRYRRLRGLDDDLGTAVMVQSMVFGNAGPTSGAGVGFTRDPSTGEDALYLDFAFNAQGEDVVAGRQSFGRDGQLNRILPAVYDELRRLKPILESGFGDMQDFELTVEEGRLFLLQTRDGQRTPWAALKIAVDLVRAGTITSQAALDRLRGLDLDRLERRRLASAAAEPLARATPASLGVASGEVALDAEQARRLADASRPAILVRHDTDTGDIEGMAAAAGILTRFGGRTSHAAVVARQLGKVCLVGCTELAVDLERRVCRLGGHEIPEGGLLSLDGDAGRVYAGEVEVVLERPEAELAEVASWRLG